MSDHLTDEDLDAIEARANAATEGTWHHGDRTHIQGAKFCQCLERNGPLIWEGPRTINGQRMQAHVHRKETADPDDHSVFVETENGGFVVAYSTFEYVPISPEDAEFIAHARTDVPALVAEVRRLRRWKAEALPVLDGLQELGHALDLPIGERITGPAALEAVERLREQRREALSLANVGVAQWERESSTPGVWAADIRDALEAGDE